MRLLTARDKFRLGWQEALIIVIIALSFTVTFASANTVSDKKIAVKDYGAHGHLFSIKEQSLIEEIMEKLHAAAKDGTLERLQAEFTKRVKQRVLRPVPVANISKAVIDRSWTYNPSYTQDTDIVDNSGKVIVAAGTTVNALDKLKWGEPLIFIDGDDREQVAFALARKGKVILTNGAPLEVGQKLGRNVYFDQGGILCRRFKIEAVPAIIEQEGKLLKVSEVKL